MSAWRRSSSCENSVCVEVRRLDDAVAVRDSKDPDGPELTFTLDEWAAFVDGMKRGEFED